MIDNLSWIAAYPEIMLLVMSCLIALVDLGVRSPLRGATYLLTLATLGCLAVLAVVPAVVPALVPAVVSAALGTEVLAALETAVLAALETAVPAALRCLLSARGCHRPL